MKINEWLKKTYSTVGTGDIYDFNEDPFINIRPLITCNDGFSMSVQASFGHYCIPRITLKDGNYESVEIGFPNMVEQLILEYAENKSNPIDSVYGYVPVMIVDRIIEKHGGIVNEL